jgi:oligopeptide/dipeptide ABC transporter ATP-binding protein
MVLELLTEVGIQNPGQIMKSYPHQLSGGMRQRVMIAMASICRPRILVADEPTTALDVTTQAHVLSLLKRVNEEFGTTILFISHDLGVINRVCDRVLIMYAGKIVERGKTRDILNHPAHQYTKGLIRSIPTRDQKGKDLICIPGRVPSTMDPREPCPFAPRCGHTMEACRQTFPECRELSKDHIVYCHMFD